MLAENDTLRRERASLATELEDWRAERDFLSLLSPPPPPHTPHMSHSPRAPPSPALPTPRTASPQPRQWCDPLVRSQSHTAKLIERYTDDVGDQGAQEWVYTKRQSVLEKRHLSLGSLLPCERLSFQRPQTWNLDG